ncbi:hypothetical protein [Mobilicoccus pelagius]|uniref:Uncharacterized protein n=1 Tax=Mobilicoccus pelagius NBRC 104925 TaxID=1089455 RepID=H5UVW6_9MICO|nr:hypothetical protein [Mobilicoccus pelagius]GAB49874.1 hypothetical protein MOPEL_135_01120 [Mobilicoccus pelagius NBRC 104925]
MTQFDGFDLSPLVQAASTDLGTVTGETRWVRVGAAELAGLTASDRDLVAVVTGERLPGEIVGELPVSFFMLQLAVDRLVGPLRGGEDVPITYVEDVYTVYEDHPAGTPLGGDLLDLALAYLAGCELAVLGPDLS